MDMAEALSALGARDDLIDERIRSRLDNDGFAVIENLLSPLQIAAFKSRIAEFSVMEGRIREGSGVYQEVGVYRVEDLINKDSVFDFCYTHPVVLAAVHHILGTFRLSSLYSRAELPGHGEQKLHADIFPAQDEGDAYKVCNAMWLLDDFTMTNGPTRFVPGSHHKRGAAHLAELNTDPLATYPDEIKLVAPAGAVVVFNGHTWHSGTRNNSDLPRGVIHAYFAGRNVAQDIDQAEYLRVRTRDRLSPAARYLLDV